MENKLRKLYLDDLLTSRQIAREIGVSFRTVLRMLDKYGIEKRVAGPKHHAILRDAEWLREQYVSQEKSTTQIANEIRASASVVCSWLKTHGIPRRRVGVHKPYIRTEAHCIPCHEVRHGRQFAKWVHQVGKISTSARPLVIG